MTNHNSEKKTLQPAEIRQFIWQQNIALGSIQSEKIIADFIEQMDKDNKALKKSSLAMLPSYLHMPESIETDKPFIAIDAGGSNFRCALVSFSLSKGQYSYKFEQEKQHPMPGTKGKLDKKTFFEQLFLYIEPLLAYSDSIGFCFSYPCEISNTLDGRLIRWTKEVNAPEVENLWIAEEFNKVLINKGIDKKKILILNDTVATLLSSRLERNEQAKDFYYAHIGLILGTGTNCAFTETTTQEIINIESGAYNGIKNTSIDNLLDEQSLNPGEYSFEKKIAGRYLGSLCLKLLQEAAAQDLMSASCCQALKAFIEENNSQLESEQLNILLRENIIASNKADQEIIQFLIEAVIERAALLSAVHLCSIAKKIQQDLKPDLKNKLFVKITIEGSTYYLLEGYQEKITRKLKGLMAQAGIHYQLLKTENASLLGAAIAAAGSRVINS